METQRENFRNGTISRDTIKVQKKGAQSLCMGMGMSTICVYFAFCFALVKNDNAALLNTHKPN